MKPKVMWWPGDRGSWSCANMLNEMLDSYGCEHFPAEIEDGIVTIFHGGNYTAKDAALTLNNWAANFPWVIFISVGDEASEFPYSELQHSNMRLWVQTPLPTTKANRYLIEGYPAHTKRQDVPKTLDWFFSGQLTHARRIACYKALEPLSGGLLRGTNGFGKGYPQEMYLEHMSAAKIVPCPSGPATPDTFRIWEALECGCVPIIDARSLRDETVGFWDTVLGGHPLPMIDDWSELPEKMKAILAGYDLYQHVCSLWWKSYKRKFNGWLAEDLLALGAK